MNNFVIAAWLLFLSLFVGLLGLIANDDLQSVIEFLASLDDGLPQGVE